jgi:hypothetical protein
MTENKVAVFKKMSSDKDGENPKKC